LCLLNDIVGFGVHVDLSEQLDQDASVLLYDIDAGLAGNDWGWNGCRFLGILLEVPAVRIPGEGIGLPWSRIAYPAGFVATSARGHQIAYS